jgi:hypothetical protein
MRRTGSRRFLLVVGLLALLGFTAVRVASDDGTSIAVAAETVEPPRLVTAPAEKIRFTQAELVGSVNPHGSPTTYYFAWGTSLTSLPNSTPVRSAGNGTHSETFRQTITGLEAGHEYFFQLVATNAGGTSKGSVGHLVTLKDTTAPVIELSGPLTEGLKEGTTEYPLHVHASDGSAAKLQSGVKSISIAVDGEVVESVEQPCPEGNCELNLDWLYETSEYAGDHSVTINASDQVGNVATQQLSLIEPDGSIPACGPSGEQRNGTPDEIRALPGGGTTAVYHEAGGVDAEFPTPPASFAAVGATQAELLEYGYPPRPSAGDKASLAEWESLVEALSPETLVAPGACVNLAEGQPAVDLPFGVEEEATPTFSGVVSSSVENDEWQSIEDVFHQPAAKSGVSCGGVEEMSSWVGLGATKRGFLQAGTLMKRGPAGNPAYRAFTERFFKDEPTMLRKVERPMILPLTIKAGDEVVSLVHWSEATEQAVMIVGVRSSGTEKFQWAHTKTKPHQPGLYYGGAVSFIGAERPTQLNGNDELGSPTELMPFETYGVLVAKAETSIGVNEPISSLEPEVAWRMQNLNGERKPTGQIMATADNLGDQSFRETWKHCHP